MISKIIKSVKRLFKKEDEIPEIFLATCYKVDTNSYIFKNDECISNDIKDQVYSLLKKDDKLLQRVLKHKSVLVKFYKRVPLGMEVTVTTPFVYIDGVLYSALDDTKGIVRANAISKLLD